jgi:hypothetical protein
MISLLVEIHNYLESSQPTGQPVLHKDLTLRLKKLIEEKPIRLDRALMNHFLRFALGGWDYLPVNDERVADVIFPLVRKLDPDHLFWKIDGQIIWKIDPWKEMHRLALLRREQREVEGAQLEVRKVTKDQLVDAVMAKFKFPPGLRKEAEKLAVQLMKSQATEVAKIFGVDISQLPDMSKPHKVIEEGKTVNEY